MRVLIADDDPAVRESLGRVLQSEGYEVVLAASGQEALVQVRLVNLDVVLLDLNMPKIGGWDVLQQIIALKPGLPVIIITAQAHQTAHATAAGARALCEKPLDLPYLLAMVANVSSYTAASRLKAQASTLVV
jgi:CheY-like chemotaxis protein